MFLYTPGPLSSDNLFRNVDNKTLAHHRSKGFLEVFKNVQGKLKALLGVEEALILSASGSGAMEAATISASSSANTKLLSLNYGKFHKRFTDIAKAHNIDYIELKAANLYDLYNLDEILKIIKEEKITCVAMSAVETQTGIRQDIRGISKAIKAQNQDTIIIVDAIASIGADIIDFSHCDFIIASSQKAFMQNTGGALVGLSRKAISLLEKSEIKGFYFNLKNELENQLKSSTAFSTNTAFVFGLVEYFDLVARSGGIEEVVNDMHKRAIAMRYALKSIGFGIYGDFEISSPNLGNFVSVLTHKKADEIREAVLEFDCVIAGAQGELKGNAMRIVTHPFIDLKDILKLLNAIEISLQRLKIRNFDSTANRLFIEKYLLK